MLIQILGNLYFWMHSPWYWIVAFAIWYIYYGIECALNGAEGGLLMPFKELGKDFTWSIPGGLKRRAGYLKQNLIPTPSLHDGKIHGSISGTISWDYDWVVENNLYKECAKDTIPGPFHFWFFIVLCPIFWPLTLIALGVLIALCIPLNLFEPVFEPVFERYFNWKEARFKSRIERKIAIRNA